MKPDSTTTPLHLTPRHWLLALLIVLAAFALRVSFTVERAYNDPQFVPTDTDMHTYLQQARGVLEGTWPTRHYYYHPAPAYFYAGVWTLVGESVPLLYLVLNGLDALTAGLLIGAGWLLTRRIGGGYLAGAVYALYPMAVVFSSSFLIAPLAAFLLALFLFLLLWQRERLAWGRTALLGLTAGALMISRLNLAPVIALYVLWLLLLRVGLRRALLHSVLFALLTAAVIAPFTLHNYRATGKTILVASTGALELYMANNRDSMGWNDLTPAQETIDAPYMEALWKDIQAAPEHFFSLQLHKLALFWSTLEPPNNLVPDHQRSYSSILPHIPLNFWSVAIPGLLGLGSLWQRDRKLALLLGALIAWICFSTMASFMYSRIRFPVVVPLLLSGAGWAVWLLDDLRQRQALRPRAWLLRYGLPALGVLLLLGFSSWALYPEARFPLKRIYHDLPADSIPVGAQFEGIELLGWRPVPQWPAAERGWVALYETYTIELLWRIPQATDEEYQFTLLYLLDEAVLERLDRPMGAVSYPHRRTPDWQPGLIYGEIVSFRFDDPQVPQERSGTVVVGVYAWDDEGRIRNISSDDGQRVVQLQTLALFNPPRPPEVPPLETAQWRFAEAILLRGYALPAEAAPGETITLQFHWEALRNLSQNYSLFVHVVDAQGQLVAQGDNLPTPGLFTANWLTDYPLLSDVPLTMPAEPGRYDILVGLYNEADRLPVGDGDFVVLGEVQVSP